MQLKIPSFDLYHYDISIVPEKCPRRVNREVIEALVDAQSDFFGNIRPVFDGRKNMYTRKALPVGRERVSVCVCVCVCVYVCVCVCACVR